MSRLSKPFRALLLVGTGLMLGAGLSVGRSVKAEREIPPPASTAAEQKSVPWRDARLLAEVLELVRKDYPTPRGDLSVLSGAAGMLGLRNSVE